jgi:hypothetical protein
MTLSSEYGQAVFLPGPKNGFGRHGMPRKAWFRKKQAATFFHNPEPKEKKIGSVVPKHTHAVQPKEQKRKGSDRP